MPGSAGNCFTTSCTRFGAAHPKASAPTPSLIAKTDLASFVAHHVRRVLQMKMPARARQSMPKRYLQLEETRLIGLVTEWLRYEAARVPFTVIETEQKTEVSIDGLLLKLRLDRIDRLNDGSLLVIDYKSGDVSPKSWDMPRPGDVQLPLYAGFALEGEDGELGGFVFAKVRAGKMEFAGRIRQAKATLRGDLRGNTNLVKAPLTAEQVLSWKKYIELLARNFLTGRAEADPRDYPDTCERCGLYALCRIQEHKGQMGTGDDSESEEAANE